MKKVLLAVLLISCSAHADYGDMHLYTLAGVYGAKTLRVTMIDSVTLTVQQCDDNGVGCGEASDFKRPNSHAKTWSYNYVGRTIPPDTITMTAKGNIIFKTKPFVFTKGDNEAENASELTAIYQPR